MELPHLLIPSFPVPRAAWSGQPATPTRRNQTCQLADIAPPEFHPCPRQQAPQEATALTTMMTRKFPPTVRVATSTAVEAAAAPWAQEWRTTLHFTTRNRNNGNSNDTHCNDDDDYHGHHDNDDDNDPVSVLPLAGADPVQVQDYPSSSPSIVVSSPLTRLVITTSSSGRSGSRSVK